MQYQKTFMVQAAHFNSLKTYKVFWDLLEEDSTGTMIGRGDFINAFRDTHGHNFKIVVKAEGDTLQEQGWLIDDVAMTRLVMEWDNINISTHTDFYETQERATTENIALKLAAKLKRTWPTLKFSVFVHETDDIVAAERTL